MDARPLDDHLIVEVDQADEKTPGGIVLPDQAKEKPQRGRVLAVGPGRMLDSGSRAPMSLRVQDHVLFGRYSGTDCEISGKRVKIMSERDVLAVMP
jgi:chaperonin GroES